MDERIRRRVVVSGVVQGVYFRASTKGMAERLGVKGWVRNLPDGRVEAVFEGAPDAVLDAVEWTTRGPERAIVESVDTFAEEPEGLLGFDVTG